jgi:hypothetical protein
LLKALEAVPLDELSALAAMPAFVSGLRRNCLLQLPWENDPCRKTFNCS